MAGRWLRLDSMGRLHTWEIATGKELCEIKDTPMGN